MIKFIFKWIANLLIMTLILFDILSIYSIVQSRSNPDRISDVSGYGYMPALPDNMRPLAEPGDLLVIENSSRYVFRIPYGGYLSAFAKTPAGLILFIILPIIYIIWTELRAANRNNARAKRETMKKRLQKITR